MAVPSWATTSHASPGNSCYAFFGFLVVSSHPILGLLPAKTDHPDISVTFGRVPSRAKRDRALEEEVFSSSTLAPSGQPTFRLFKNCDGMAHVLYGDGVEFWIDPSSGHIWSIWPESVTFGSVTLYLLGPIFGLMLRFRGVVCLHASSVVIDDRAFLFTGDAGAGKSTTAAAMSQRGHALLADDIVAITDRDGKFLATPAYPYISLWPESTKMICGPGAKLPALINGFEKQRFSPANFQNSPVPLGGIFAFGERSAGEDLPRIDELTPREQLMTLVANSYGSHVLPDSSRAEEFQLFGRMVGAVPIRRLLPHSDPALLNRLCELIEQESRSSQSRAFAA